MQLPPETMSRSVILEPVTTANALAFKTVRLQALQDTPTAFGSTYAKEALLTDAEWKARGTRWNSPGFAAYLAVEAEAVCGVAGSFLEKQQPRQAQLISMWVAPTHRQRGVGRQLVTELLDWARHNGALIMSLMVTSNNDSAMRFYERLGFMRTGRTIPYPHDSSLMEFEMSRRLG